MKLKILIRSNRLLLSLGILLFSILLWGRENNQDRLFNEQEMAVYADSNDYAYMNYTVRPPSIWQRLQWWFGDLVGRLFNNPNAPWLTEALFYAILLVVLSVAIFYIIRLRYVGSIRRDSKQFQGYSSQVGQPDSETDFDELILQAVEKHNFRLAIRYLYLKSLFFLASKDQVTLKDWKSPYDYQQELSGELVPIYGDLTRLFEYVWYGDFDVHKEEYQKGHQLAGKLESKLV